MHKPIVNKFLRSIIGFALLFALNGSCKKPPEIQAEGLPCAGGEKTNHVTQEYLGEGSVWAVRRELIKNPNQESNLVNYQKAGNVIYFPLGTLPGEWATVQTQRTTLEIGGHPIIGNSEPILETIKGEQYCFTQENGGEVFVRRGPER